MLNYCTTGQGLVTTRALMGWVQWSFIVAIRASTKAAIIKNKMNKRATNRLSISVTASSIVVWVESPDGSLGYRINPMVTPIHTVTDNAIPGIVILK